MDFSSRGSIAGGGTVLFPLAWHLGYDLMNASHLKR
jgi:hypothetical protein